jgi:hypothetical protein
MRLLRQYIRSILLEAAHDREEEKDPEGKRKSKNVSDDELILEPDSSKESKRDGAKDEVNAIGIGGGAPVSTGNIAGVTTPLGTGPTYPAKRKKKKKKKALSGGEDWYKN